MCTVAARAAADSFYSCFSATIPIYADAIYACLNRRGTILALGSQTASAAADRSVVRPMAAFAGSFLYLAARCSLLKGQTNAHGLKAHLERGELAASGTIRSIPPAPR